MNPITKAYEGYNATQRSAKVVNDKCQCLRDLVCLILAVTVIMLFVLLCAGLTHTDTASYYTYESCRREGTSGVYTASGEQFNENDLTCAMRRRDWGTMFRVTNLDNGKSVIVRLTDFGPNKKLHAKGRTVDLSKGDRKSVV